MYLVSKTPGEGRWSDQLPSRPGTALGPWGTLLPSAVADPGSAPASGRLSFHNCRIRSSQQIFWQFDTKVFREYPMEKGPDKVKRKQEVTRIRLTSE